MSQFPGARGRAFARSRAAASIRHPLRAAAVIAAALALTASVSYGTPPPGGTAVLGPDLAASGSQQAALQRAQADAAERNSPDALARALQSRDEHRNLDAAQALAHDQASQPALMKLRLGQLLQLRSSEQVVDYHGKYSAIVSDNGQRGVVDSTLPLREPGPDGELEPVNLDLHTVGLGFEPDNAIVPLRVGPHASSDLAVGTAGIDVQPLVGAADVSAQLVDGRVFWANAATDTDVVAMPTPGGAEVSYLLRSPDSPEALTLGLKLPDGVSGNTDSNGIKLMRGGEKVGFIWRPAARDADGREVAVTYSVDAAGNLVMHVDHRGQTVQYPIAVDPEIGTNTGDQLWDHGAGFDGWNFNNWGGIWSGATWDVGAGSPGASISFQAGTYGAWLGGDYYHNAPGNSYISQVSTFGVRWWLAGSYIQSFVQRYAGGAWQLETQWYDTRPAPNTVSSGFFNVGPLYSSDRTPDSYAFVLRMETDGGTGYRGFNMGHWTGTEMVYGDQHAPTNLQVGMPQGWVSTTHADPTITLAADDDGVGTKTIGYAVGGAAQVTRTAGCTGAWNSYCNTSNVVGVSNYRPNGTMSITEHLNAYPGLSEGTQPLTATFTDLVGNSTGAVSAQQQLQIDNTAPKLTLSNSLWDARSTRIPDGSYNLDVAASDLLGDGVTEGSGVHSLTISLDGNAQVANGGSSCSLSSCSWTLQTERFAAGKHTVSVSASDAAGNPSTQTFDFTISRAPSAPVGPGAVDLKTGNLQISRTDVSTTSLGAGLSVSRAYNSRDLTGGATGPFGPGWVANLPVNDQQVQYSQAQRKLGGPERCR